MTYPTFPSGMGMVGPGVKTGDLEWAVIILLFHSRLSQGVTEHKAPQYIPTARMG